MKNFTFSSFFVRQVSRRAVRVGSFNPKMSLDLEVAVNDRGVDFERSSS